MFSLKPFLRCCAIMHFCCQLLNGFSSPSVHPHNAFNAPFHLITLCPASQPPAPSKASLPRGLLTPSSKLGSLQDSIRAWQVFLSYPVPKWLSWAHLLEGPRLLLPLTRSFVLCYSICSSTCPFHRAQNPPCATSTFRAQFSEGCTQPASVSFRNTRDQPQASFHTVFILWLVWHTDWPCFPRLLSLDPSYWQPFAQARSKVIEENKGSQATASGKHTTK